VIVVTGAAGVIGRALMARLSAERLPCLVLSRDVFAEAEGIPLLSTVPRRPSAVVHLAALVPQPPAIPDDDSSAARTRNIDQRVLEAVRQWGCHVIYASGCSLYEKGGTAPKQEREADAAVAQASPYLAAKQQGERDFLALSNATVLRISAPIGEGLSRATVLGAFHGGGASWQGNRGVGQRHARAELCGYGRPCRRLIPYVDHTATCDHQHCCGSAGDYAGVGAGSRVRLRSRLYSYDWQARFQGWGVCALCKPTGGRSSWVATYYIDTHIP
jgi:hypothetical protein